MVLNYIEYGLGNLNPLGMIRFSLHLYKNIRPFLDQESFLIVHSLSLSKVQKRDECLEVLFDRPV